MPANICGKKIEIYGKSAKQQHRWDRFFAISKKIVITVQCIDRFESMYL